MFKNGEWGLFGLGKGDFVGCIIYCILIISVLKGVFVNVSY